MGKRVSYNTPGHLHELTFSTYKRAPVLELPECSQELLDMLCEAKSKCRFQLNGYCFMTDHVHLLISPTDEKYSISKILHAIKARSAIGIKRILERDAPFDLLDTVRLPNGSVRIWQSGGGFDRNVFSDRLAINSLTYIHNNPVKARLASFPEEYCWSSAKAYAIGDSSVVDLLELR